jgi:hypothetical protein
MITLASSGASCDDGGIGGLGELVKQAHDRSVVVAADHAGAGEGDVQLARVPAQLERGRDGELGGL